MEQRGMLVRTPSHPSSKLIVWVIVAVGVVNLGALLSGCGNSAPTPRVVAPSTLSYEGLTPPTTIGELLRLVNKIGERRLWDRDDLYLQNPIKRLFGSQRISVTEVPEQAVEMHLFGFRDLLTPLPDDVT